MIRIYRGDESDALADAREQHLARALLRGGPPTTFDGYRTDVEALLDRHYEKCAYCEIDVRSEATPVEHVRPKSDVTRVVWSGLRSVKLRTRATRNDDAEFKKGLPPVDRDRLRWTPPAAGYWWLAWTWENLLLACTGCNTGLKRTCFPLRRGSPVMTIHGQLPSVEQALLIDPTRDDPMDHICFEYDGTSRWRALPRDGSELGAWTIFVLHLNSPRLIGKYTRRVRDLEKWAQPLKDLVDAKAPAASCARAWLELCAHALDPVQPFLALTHDWLEAQWSVTILKGWGVSLARPTLCLPGVSRQPTVRPALPLRQALQPLPESLQLEIRAQRHLVNLTQERRAVITQLLAWSPPFMDADIASVVNCDPADVQRCRQR